MNIENVKLSYIYRKAKEIIDNGSQLNDILVESIPDSGVNIINQNKNGITIRSGWGFGQIEILLNEVRHNPASKDLQLTRDSVKDLFEAIDADRKTDSTMKAQIKNLIESFINLA